MARNLQIHTKGRYERMVNPTTGAYSMICSQDMEKTSTEIPRAFLAALPVFEGGEVYRVEMRIRFQLVDAAPSFAFSMHRRAEIERDAFGAVRQVAEKKTGLPMFSGDPES
jgi:hypothetical protein